MKVLAFSGQTSQEGVATKRSFYKSRKSFDIELSSFEKGDSEGGLALRKYLALKTVPIASYGINDDKTLCATNIIHCCFINKRRG